MVQYGSESSVRNKFVLVSEEDKGTKVVLLEDVLLLLNMSARKDSEPADFAFILFMECTDFSEHRNGVLGCMRVQTSADDEVNHVDEIQADSKQPKPVGCENGLEWIRLTVYMEQWKWFVPIIDLSLQKFTKVLHWAHVRFSANRFKNSNFYATSW